MKSYDYANDVPLQSQIIKKHINDVLMLQGMSFSLENKCGFHGRGNLKNDVFAEDHDLCCFVWLPFENQSVQITCQTDQIMTPQLQQQQPNKTKHIKQVRLTDAGCTNHTILNTNVE